MRLHDYVAQKIKEDSDLLQVKTYFGFETTGNYINKWQTSFYNIQRFTKFKGVSGFGNEYIQIYVKTTETGITPLTADEQPYGWDGKINENTAELAIWWAFEILTQDEADTFIEEQKPSVIFIYPDYGKVRSLHVKFNGNEWIIIDDVM